MPAIAASVALTWAGLVLASPCASALAAPASLGQQATARANAPSLARFGPNLLRNPGAQAGAFAVGGWDAVTIPGWQVVAGLPTVVTYGTTHFPPVTGRASAVRGGRPILIGIYSYPTAIQLAPTGTTAVVVSPYAGQVTLLDTASRRAVATVNVGNYPVAAAIAQ